MAGLPSGSSWSACWSWAPASRATLPARFTGRWRSTGLALLSALSSFWSGSAELSVIEADRALVYLGFFLAAFLIAQTDKGPTFR